MRIIGDNKVINEKAKDAPKYKLEYGRFVNRKWTEDGIIEVARCSHCHSVFPLDNYNIWEFCPVCGFPVESCSIEGVPFQQLVNAFKSVEK